MAISLATGKPGDSVVLNLRPPRSNHTSPSDTRTATGCKGRTAGPDNTAAFKLPLCADIRSGTITRSDARRQHSLSSNLIELWLTQYDRLAIILIDACKGMLLQTRYLDTMAMSAADAASVIIARLGTTGLLEATS